MPKLEDPKTMTLRVRARQDGGRYRAGMRFETTFSVVELTMETAKKIGLPRVLDVADRIADDKVLEVQVVDESAPKLWRRHLPRVRSEDLEEQPTKVESEGSGDVDMEEARAHVEKLASQLREAEAEKRELLDELAETKEALADAVTKAEEAAAATEAHAAEVEAMRKELDEFKAAASAKPADPAKPADDGKGGKGGKGGSKPK